MPTLSISLKDGEGAAIAEAALVFDLLEAPVLDGAEATASTRVESATDVSGNASVVLRPGDWLLLINDVDRMAVRIPTVAGTYLLEDVRIPLTETASDYGLLTQPVASTEDWGGVT